MKIAFTKNIWSIVCLACFVLVGTSCNKNIGVEAVYITAAEKSSVTTFSATNENDEFGITISSSLIANSDIEGELTIHWWINITETMVNLIRHCQKVLVFCLTI